MDRNIYTDSMLENLEYKATPPSSATTQKHHWKK